MKRIILSLLIVLMPAVAALQAKPVKRPDSYAFTRGVEAFQAEKYSEAADWFKQELKDNPGNAYVYTYLAFIHEGNKEHGAALSAINNALKKGSKKDKEWHARNYATRAGIYLQMEDSIQAVNDMTTAISILPNDPQMLDLRADLYYELRKYDLSDNDYLKIIKLDEGSTNGYMGLGRNAKAQKNHTKAIDLFSKAIMLSPSYSSGYSFRADSYLELGEIDKATDDLVKALGIDGDDKAFYHATHLPSEKAVELMRNKLIVAQTKEPTDRYWPFVLGSLEYSTKDYPMAISYFEKTFEMDAHPLLLMNIAKCYEQLENYDKVLEYTNRGLDMDSDDLTLLDLKRSALSQLGRYDEALQTIDAYISLYPSDFSVYTYKGDLLMDKEDWNEALKNYNLSMTLEPMLETYPYALLKRGDAYRKLGQKEKAMADYNKLLEVEKDSVLDTNSWTPFALNGLGHNQEAIETMRTIVENDTIDKNGSMYNLACIYARTGDNENSIKTLQTVLENDYKRMAHAKVDYDLAPLRDLPEFITLIENIEKKRDQAKSEGSEEENVVYETVEIPFTKESGVTKVKCTINDLPLHFVFDTGASDVTISMVEANFMFKNDYINKNDIVGSSRYMDANGDVSEGTIINLKKVNFGGLELDNVRASVVRNQRAPLLLGQSVLGRLGKIEIDNQSQTLKITHKVGKK